MLSNSGSFALKLKSQKGMQHGEQQKSMGDIGFFGVGKKCWKCIHGSDRFSNIYMVCSSVGVSIVPGI